MGAFTSQIVLSESKACAKHTDPNMANWVTVHAVATECKHLYIFHTT